MDSQVASGDSVARRSPLPAEGSAVVLPMVVIMPRLRMARPSASVPKTEPPSESRTRTAPRVLGSLAKVSNSRGGGDVTDGGNPDAAVRSARVGWPLAPPFEAHRRAPAVVLGYRWRGVCLDDATSKRECAPNQSAHADPHQWPFARRFSIGVCRRAQCPTGWQPLFRGDGDSGLVPNAPETAQS